MNKISRRVTGCRRMRAAQFDPTRAHTPSRPTSSDRRPTGPMPCASARFLTRSASSDGPFPFVAPPFACSCGSGHLEETDVSLPPPPPYSSARFPSSSTTATGLFEQTLAIFYYPPTTLNRATVPSQRLPIHAKFSVPPLPSYSPSSIVSIPSSSVPHAHFHATHFLSFTTFSFPFPRVASLLGTQHGLGSLGCKTTSSYSLTQASPDLVLHKYIPVCVLQLPLASSPQIVYLVPQLGHRSG
jgi:hypothetical protein